MVLMIHVKSRNSTIEENDADVDDIDDDCTPSIAGGAYRDIQNLYLCICMCTRVATMRIMMMTASPAL